MSFRNFGEALITVCVSDFATVSVLRIFRRIFITIVISAFANYVNSVVAVNIIESVGIFRRNVLSVDFQSFDYTIARYLNVVGLVFSISNCGVSCIVNCASSGN